MRMKKQRIANKYVLPNAVTISSGVCPGCSLRKARQLPIATDRYETAIARGIARMIKSITAAATRNQKPAYCRDAGAISHVASAEFGVGNSGATRPKEKPIKGRPQEIQNGLPSLVMAPHAEQVMITPKIKG